MTHVDPCMVVTPPCMSEADRYSLEALRSIHQMMDDDQDGGIEVEESVEVQNSLFISCLKSLCMYVFLHARDRQGKAIQQQVSWLVVESNATSRIATV